jgi:hypothetical protein
MAFTLDTQFFTITFTRNGPDDVDVLLVPKTPQIGPAKASLVITGLQDLSSVVGTVSGVLAKYDLQ